MEIKRFFPLLGIAILLCFCQCKSVQVRRIEKLIKTNTRSDYLNQDYLDKSRKFMFDLLPEASKSDTVIILEYWRGIPSPSYACTIYESKNNKVKRYITVSSLVKNGIRVDSLEQTDLKDYILPMILNNQLEEIKKRGDSSGFTPATTLIINILIKNKLKKKFDIQRLETLDFPYRPY